MNFYFFGGIEFEKKYNCNLLTIDEWYNTGVKRPMLGLLSIIFGIVLQVFLFLFYQIILLLYIVNYFFTI